MRYFMILLIFLFCGCEKKQNNNEITFLLDWTPNVHHSGLFVAKNLGFFKNEGISVRILSAGNESTKEVISRNGANLGISFQTSLTKSMDKKSNLIAIATILQKHYNGFLYNSKLIKTPADLNHKIYGGYDTKIDNLIIKTLIKSDPNYKGEPIKLKFLNSYDMDLITSILKGDSDFAWGYEDVEGIEAKLRGLSLGFFNISKYSKDLIYYDPIIIANRDFLKNNKDLVKKFLKALSKGYKFAAKNPNKAAKILIKNSPLINEKLIFASQDLASKGYLDENGEWGFMKKEIWSNFTKFLYDNKVINRLISNDELFSNEYLSD